MLGYSSLIDAVRLEVSGEVITVVLLFCSIAYYLIRQRLSISEPHRLLN